MFNLEEKMQVSVEITEGLGRNLNIKVPAEEIDNKVNERVKEVAKTAKLDGFRAGKVPLKVVEKRYGGSIRQEILAKVLEASYIEAIKQEKLNPAGHPQIDVKTFEPGKPLEYVAKLEIYPEIKLVELDGAEIEQFKSEVADTDVEKVIKDLQKQQTEWTEVARAAKNEDQVIIDFEGFIDDKAFDGGKAEKNPLVLGSKSMIPGFEDGIVGAKTGDDLEVKVNFPKDYQSKDLAGKEAVFKIKVHKVSEPKLPELNNEFIKRFGIKEGGLDKLREKIRNNLKLELKSAIKIKNKSAVMDKLLEFNTVDLPKAAIELEMGRLHQQAMARYGDVKDKKKLPQIPKEIFKEQAERRVKLGLIVAEVVKKHDIKFDDKHVRALVEDVSKGYDQPEQIIDWYYADKKRLEQFEMVAMEDGVVDKLLSSAKVKEKSLGVEEALNK
jgi:trigger factor